MITEFYQNQPRHQQSGVPIRGTCLVNLHFLPSLQDITPSGTPAPVTVLLLRTTPDPTLLISYLITSHHSTSHVILRHVVTRETHSTSHVVTRETHSTSHVVTRETHSTSHVVTRETHSTSHVVTRETHSTSHVVTRETHSTSHVVTRETHSPRLISRPFSRTMCLISGRPEGGCHLLLTCRLPFSTLLLTLSVPSLLVMVDRLNIFS